MLSEAKHLYPSYVIFPNKPSTLSSQDSRSSREWRAEGSRKWREVWPLHTVMLSEAKHLYPSSLILPNKPSTLSPQDSRSSREWRIAGNDVQKEPWMTWKATSQHCYVERSETSLYCLLQVARHDKIGGTWILSWVTLFSHSRQRCFIYHIENRRITRTYFVLSD